MAKKFKPRNQFYIDDIFNIMNKKQEKKKRKLEKEVEAEVAEKVENKKEDKNDSVESEEATSNSVFSEAKEKLEAVEKITITVVE